MPKVSKKDPEKPKGAKNAYNFFLQDNKERMKDNAMSLKEFSRECAEKWKSMSDEDKKPFNDKAAEDKERYKTAMASYSPPPDSEEPTKKRKKQAKDPNRPKRNLNPYLFFLNEKREGVKEGLTNPTAGEVVKILSDMWTKLPEDDKKKYQEMAQKDRERYQQELEEYNKEQQTST